MIIVLQTRKANTLKSSVLLFFLLPTLFTGWLAEDCHFHSNAPKHNLCISHDQNVDICGRKKCPFGGSKMAKFATKKWFAPNALKSHLGLSHHHNLQNLHIFGVKNFKICQKKLFAPNVPPNHLESPITNICIFGGSKMPILGVKNAKMCT